MAAGIMPKLGEPLTCDEPCAHSDCAATRELIGRLCVICLRPVNSGESFYEAPSRARMAGQIAITHAVCEESAPA